MKMFFLLFALLLPLGSQAWAQTKWYDPLAAELPIICGRAWNKEIGANYYRFPERFKDVMPHSVWALSRQSAGLMVRFRSNSSSIKVKYTLAHHGGYKNMAPLCHGGVDLYAQDANGKVHWIGNHMGWNYSDTVTVTFTGIKTPFLAHRGLDFQLYLPPYSETTSLALGVDSTCNFEFIPQSAERPIVIYGSSIVQGASPSRPGLMWTNILQRETDYPVVNLGFSGSALMEPALFDAMAEIDARAFILDPMPNSYGLGEEIFNRMVHGVHKLREKSAAPILLVESSASPDSVFKPELYRIYRKGDEMLRKAYDSLRSEGVSNLYYLSHHELGLGEDSWIEGVHPNDLGNREYADACIKKLQEMLPEDKPNPRFMPVRQHRDGLYSWLQRHNEVIRLNHTTDPEVLMIGNSITHFWGGEPVCEQFHSPTWKKLFKGRRVTNMGFGWDRIENVYWRIFHGELEGCAPRAICLNIGINNLGSGSEQNIAQGIADLASLIRIRQPQARLYVFKPYPCRGREKQVEALGKHLESCLSCDAQTILVDLSSCLLRKDDSGKIDESLFRDGLHPNDKGYGRIVKAFSNYFKD